MIPDYIYSYINLIHSSEAINLNLEECLHDTGLFIQVNINLTLEECLHDTGLYI